MYFLFLPHHRQQVPADGLPVQGRAGEAGKGQDGLLHQQLHAADGREAPVLGPPASRAVCRGWYTRSNTAAPGGSASRKERLAKGGKPSIPRGVALMTTRAVPGRLGQPVQGDVPAVPCRRQQAAVPQGEAAARPPRRCR